MGESQTFQNNGPGDESPMGRSSSSSVSSPHLTRAPQSQRQDLLSSEGEQDSCSNSEAMSENLGAASPQTSSPDSKEEHSGENISSNTSDSSRVSEGTGVQNQPDRKKKQKKKPKSESSVVHDKEKGVCTCKRCGWIYPNPRPSAKLRREHRKHCGKFHDVHAWLSLEQEEGEAAEDLTMKDSEGEDSSSNHSAQQEEASDIIVEQQEVEKEDRSSSQPVHQGDEPGSSSAMQDVIEGEREDDEVQVEELTHRAGNGAQDTSSTSQEDLHPKELEGNSKITSENDQNSQEAEGSKTTEYDLEKILKEQTSHHLLCPNCGSCITKRVILRKRKRTGGFTVSTAQQEKQPKLEQPAETERDRGVEIEQVSTPAPAEEERDEVEAWSCLACFAIFFRTVREALDEPLDRAQHFSCLPYLLPDFHWDGDGSQIIREEEQEDRRSSSCLPIEFPWTRAAEPGVQEELDETPREVETSMDSTPQEPTTPVSQTIQEEQQQERRTSSCLPIEFPWTKATQLGVQEEVDETPREVETSAPQEATASPAEDNSEQREWSSCIPITLPLLQKSTAEVASHDEQEQQAADRFSCMPILLPTYWGPDEPASPIQEPDSAETNENKAGLSCLPDLIPSYSWTTRKSYDQQTPEQEPKIEPAKDEQEVVPEPEPKPTEPEPKPEVEPKPELEVKGEPRETPEAEVQPAVDSTPEQVEESANVSSGAEDERCNCNCIPVSWGSEKVAPVSEVRNEERDMSLNCIPVLFPSFTWDGDGEYVRSHEKKETKKEDLPITLPARQESEEEKMYITKETRIQAWIKTITNVVTVRPARKQTDAVQIGNETSFLDMTVSQKTDGRESKATAETLVSTPSTGWALYDAIDKTQEKAAEDEDEIEEDDVKLKRPQKFKELEQEAEIQEVPPEQPAKVQEDKHVPPPLELGSDLREPLLTSEEKPKDLDVEGILSAFVEQKPSPGPVSTTVSVRGSDSIIEITGDDPKQAVETALGIASDLSNLTPVLPEQQPEPVQEYVKSIVYGGLDVTLTSLAVISSGAGAGTKTINVVAMSIANLVAGLITLLYSVRTLYKTNRPSFEQYVGQKLWLNGGIAVISFIVFGLIAPLTYALSFRAEDDKDYKFVATAAASLGCLLLMGLGKAYVQKESYAATITSLLVTGFAASVAGYFAGDYVKRWLQKLGFDTDETPPSPAAPSPPWPPFGLHLPGGRRGGASF